MTHDSRTALPNADDPNQPALSQNPRIDSERSIILDGSLPRFQTKRFVGFTEPRLIKAERVTGETTKD